jgi:Transposase DDE domain/Transposase domain (DUF772)
MLTCKSPRKVMLVAYRLAKTSLPTYSSEFSRHDFTLPQLFACLVLREHQKKSYRGVEALLEDSPQWRQDIGLVRTPDHNTLCNAFKRLIKPRVINSMLDQTARWAKERKLLSGRDPLSLDTSMFESRHVSRHFEKRQRQSARDRRKKARKTGEKQAGDRRRSRVVRGLPKLSLAVATRCHLILAARATTGAGADQPFFEPLLFDAWRRANVKVAVADAGFDSEANHCIARQDMGVRSIIPPNAGRPTDKLPTGRHRRNMHHRFKRKADKKNYGQRWQSETVNSMIKRNQGSALRATTARRRSKELLLRVITHNVMILQ